MMKFLNLNPESRSYRQFLSQSTYGEETLAFLNQFQIHREILDNTGQTRPPLAIEKLNVFQLQGLRALTPDHALLGLCPWTPLGTVLADPHYRLEHLMHLRSLRPINAINKSVRDPTPHKPNSPIRPC